MTTSTIYLKQSCIKTLTAVETNRNASNQHEFNGVSQLKQIFGNTRVTKNAIFSIRGMNLLCEDIITWYDARENSPDRSEFRLYFRDNDIMKQAEEGDNIIVGIDDNDKIHIILIKQSNSKHEENIPNWS
ncbi:type II restriction endonuclease [Edwardsiella tarda]|uniref:type II restriction endonuclease n=1 Tax=Edwardsiella tarda TaxID=636 RepID=UPI000D50EE46|nr:type II restriction endonuclease [Edwardsiella tarda]UCQ18232.1 type II restriction endonuclease [Edwardsiella tarda]